MTVEEFERMKDVVESRRPKLDEIRTLEKAIEIIATAMKAALGDSDFTKLNLGFADSGDPAHQQPKAKP